ALKLLPAHFTTNQERLRRFQQEARMASALNHPNIITIHEIGQVENRNFIATEFVDGETLRQRLKRGALSLPESLDIAIQICRALAAAHNAGIVHRDIKPENIMLRHDGYVKVLDFGLAKLTEQRERPAQGDLSDRVDISSGLLMGTVKYMSPEQAQGQQVNQQSDLFSLGVVLYEMLTGHTPFNGEDTSRLVNSILQDEPQRLTAYALRAPEELQGIVSKALTKNSVQRYQTAEDLLVDLKTLKQQLELSTESPSALHREDRTSSKFRSRTLAALFIVFITTGLGVTVYRRRHLSNPTSLPQGMRITRLTSGGAWGPVISPDGKFIAHANTDVNGQESIRLREIITGDSVQLVASQGGGVGPIVFSPDGNYFYFSRMQPDEQSVYFQSDIFRIPVIGGTPQKVLSNAGGVGPSPDDKQLFFYRADPATQETKLLVADSYDTGERVVYTRKWPDIAWCPSWSPDGKLLTYSVRNRDGDHFYNSVAAVPVDGGAERLLTSYRWRDVWGPTWLSDGSGFLVEGRERVGDPIQIYYVTYPSGEVRKLTDDANSYLSASISADSKTIVADVQVMTSKLWVVPADNTSSARQITYGGSDGFGGVAWTPDGRIVFANFSSEEDFTRDGAIWIVDADGQNRKRLTYDDRMNADPIVTPDGRYIVFSSYREGVWGIWRMNLDGSDQKQLAAGSDPMTNPYASTDGRWVVFKRGPLQASTVCKISIDGGDVTRLTDRNAYPPSVSPDGKLVSFFATKGNENELVFISAAGGAPVKTLDVSPNSRFLLFTLITRWSGDLLTYIDNKREVANIYGLPLGGGPARQLTNFNSDTIFSFDWSPDGKQLVVARGQFNHEIVLLTGFR
ncbi:MAG TPA: protein kinase, partial [Pyrinomonadaceae bacterium]|nr:protein kinase [Pyrinomonadaceae bacterium]